MAFNVNTFTLKLGFITMKEREKKEVLKKKENLKSINSNIDDDTAFGLALGHTPFYDEKGDLRFLIN